MDKKDIGLENLDSVSKRLKYIVDTIGVKQSYLAEKLGVSPSGLHYILNNDVKFSKNIKKIADYLNVNETWLSTGEGEIYEENTSIKTYKIPVYYPDQLKLYYRSSSSTKVSTNDFLLTATAYSNPIIGVYITETNFIPKFELGDKVAFEQTSNFEDGEILLIYFGKTNSIAVKYGFHLGSETIVLSYSEAPAKLISENGDIIIGVYRECFKKTSN